MGFYPPLWGPKLWHSIHILTLSFPAEPTAEDREAALQFLVALTRLLPCPWCRVHFRQLLVQLPPDVSSKEAFADWGRLAHNAVSKRLGKREWDRQEFQQHYLRAMFDPAAVQRAMDGKDTDARVRELEADRSRLETEKRELVDASLSERLALEAKLSQARHTAKRNDQIYLAIGLVVLVLFLVLAVLLFFLGQKRGRRRADGVDVDVDVDVDADAGEDDFRLVAEEDLY